MEKKLVLQLAHHNVYYVKNDVVSYYITIPKDNNITNICIELKSKMDNYNLDMNDELWVMENVKNTFSFIDNYNITLVLPILDEHSTSLLEKIDSSVYDSIDKILGQVINFAYHDLKSAGKEIDSQVILINNDRYKTFITWFTSRYNNRIICKNLLDIIQLYNVNATSYKKVDTPAMSFVVGSYASEVDAPKVIKEEETPQQQLVPQTSSGFSSYWLLAILTIVVAGIVAFISFMMK